MPAVTLVDFRESFPTIDRERKVVAQEWLERLTEEWFNAGLPGPDMFYVLVHRPGELASSHERATHMGDESEAREQETGMVAVAVTLTDVLAGAEGFAAWRIRRNAQ